MPDVLIVGWRHNELDGTERLARACRRYGLTVEHNDIPLKKFSDLIPTDIATYNSLLQRGNARLKVFLAGGDEFVLSSADLTIAYSAYRDWFDSKRQRVIPMAWPPARPDDLEQLLWRNKPPFRIGFMGSSYRHVRVAKLLSRAPVPVRKLALEGRHFRHPKLLAAALQRRVPLIYALTFPRFEALDVLEQGAAAVGADLEIIATEHFTGSDAQISRYVDHMTNVTYVLCARGSENYSFRTYEALRFGRVPVIIDTDMVLPPEVDWSEVAVVVPYRDLHRLPEILADDYSRHSPEAFAERQRKGMSISTWLETGAWFDDIAREIAERLNGESITSQDV